MQSVTALVSQGICVPDTVFLDVQEVKDALQTTLKHINGALVLTILFFDVFSLLLSPVDLIHNVFELLASRLKLALGGVTNAVGAMSRDLLLDVADLFPELLLLGIQLTHIVVQGVVLRLGLLETLYDLLKGAVHADSFLDSGESLFVLLDFLHGNVDGASVTGNGPGSSGSGTSQLISIGVCLGFLIVSLGCLVSLALRRVLLVLFLLARFCYRSGLILDGN